MRRPCPSLEHVPSRAPATLTTLLLLLLSQTASSFSSSPALAFNGVNPTHNIASQTRSPFTHHDDGDVPKLAYAARRPGHHASGGAYSHVVNAPHGLSATGSSAFERPTIERHGVPASQLSRPWLRPSARSSSSRLWMSSPAPPVKPPKKRGWGGGGGGDELYVRELVEPEKSEILTKWRTFAKADGGEKFVETLNIINDMIAFRSGVIAARKRQFTLACCKGTAVQAVACVQIGPKNDDVRSFLAQEACMSLCLLTVDPASPQFKAGAHLCKELKEIGRLENMAVSFQPIKNIYSGRFYVATLTM